MRRTYSHFQSKMTCSVNCFDEKSDFRLKHEAVLLCTNLYVMVAQKH